MHLADAFIQSDFKIQVIHLLSVCQYVCSLGIEPTTFVLLTECSTTEPQEHLPEAILYDTNATVEMLYTHLSHKQMCPVIVWLHK